MKFEIFCKRPASKKKAANLFFTSKNYIKQPERIPNFCYTLTMEIPEFGKNPIDVYSKPVGVTETKLTRIFQMQAREKPEKPGRSLLVTWDARLPLVKGFNNKYSYLVIFDGKNNLAGNHYHEHKQELFNPVGGDFVVLLEDIETKEREELEISAKDYPVVYIPTRIAHTVVANSNIAVLLVTASYPGIEDDEFPYKLR